MSMSGGDLMRDFVEVVAEIDTHLRKLEQVRAWAHDPPDGERAGWTQPSRDIQPWVSAKVPR
jgi:hypothetical protein